jgi:hypothetical protein
LRATALVRGSRETIGLLEERALAPIENELTELADFLTERLGPGWVEEFHAWRRGRADAP